MTYCMNMKRDRTSWAKDICPECKKRPVYTSSYHCSVCRRKIYGKRLRRMEEIKRAAWWMDDDRWGFLTRDAARKNQ